MIDPMKRKTVYDLSGEMVPYGNELKNHALLRKVVVFMLGEHSEIFMCAEVYRTLILYGHLPPILFKKKSAPPLPLQNKNQINLF